jgi:phosphate starvation-inducible PhoH-like protein
MSEATIPVVNSQSLLTLFGTRDQHLRKIRDTLGVAISSRDDRIHIAGDESAVAHATEVFEQLKVLAERHGKLAPDEVAQILARVSGHADEVEQPGFELHHAGRTIRPRTAGQARWTRLITSRSFTRSTARPFP